MLLNVHILKFTGISISLTFKCRFPYYLGGICDATRYLLRRYIILVTSHAVTSSVLKVVLLWQNRHSVPQPTVVQLHGPSTSSYPKPKPKPNPIPQHEYKAKTRHLHIHLTYMSYLAYKSCCWGSSRCNRRRQITLPLMEMLFLLMTVHLRLVLTIFFLSLKPCSYRYRSTCH